MTYPNGNGFVGIWMKSCCSSITGGVSRPFVWELGVDGVVGRWYMVFGVFLCLLVYKGLDDDGLLWLSARLLYGFLYFLCVFWCCG